MLYNESTGKPKPLTVDSLVSWLEQQPANGTYDSSRLKSCLLGQWLRGGRSEFETAMASFQLGTTHPFRTIADIGGQGPHTMGAALERARAVLS